jgi:hypothetical protein
MKWIYDLFIKLTLFLGYTYMINKRSKEIHDLKNTHVNCHLDKISDVNSVIIHKSKLQWHLNNGYNGCRWCMPKQDTDKLKH